jgi:hypothetical protein
MRFFILPETERFRFQWRKPRTDSVLSFPKAGQPQCLVSVTELKPITESNRGDDGQAAPRPKAFRVIAGLKAWQDRADGSLV